MQGDAEAPRPVERLGRRRLLPTWGKGPQFLADQGAVPFQGEGARHQDMVVLEEFPERDQDLPEIRDHPDPGPERFRGLRVRDFHKVPAVQDDERTVDRFAWRDRAGLPRTLRLDLGADGDEVVQDVHRRRVEGDRGESRGPRPPVPEAQSARAARVAEDGPARDHVLDEHLVRFDARVFSGLLGPGPLAGEVGIDELPAVDPEFPDVLLDLRGLEAHAVRDDETGPASDTVRLDPRQVPEAADLRVLGPLSVDRDRTV